MGFLRNLMAMPGNLKPFINGQNRLILDFRFLLKNAYFSKTKCGHFWEVVVGVHRPPHLIFKLFQCKSLPVFVAGVCVYTVCPGYTPYSQSPPS